SVFDLLKGSLIISIPIFIAAWLGLKVRGKLQARFKLKWASSSFLTIFLFSALLLIIAYAVPMYSQVWAESLNLQKAPEFFQPTLYDYFLIAITSIAKIIITSIAISLILLPFLLLGSLAKPWMERKTKNTTLGLFLACWVSTLVFAFLFFFVFKFAFLGIVYMLYFY
ncbi:MAG: hypothetical protein Q7S92_05760, partial [Candidatus Diapherotrites archaeon]|nr:hypothetical protein [Candidatus Diapherotrites archaeon]